ncbi:MAG: ketopantoate reductase family protein [Hyphomicrobiaceae bacterium]|nr:ketopantoate reductase family protein [Hyphomicrobiaceae bacterium]
MHILCLGAGGIGGYFGGRLVEAKAADVTFLVRPGRKAQLDAEGLRVESVHGDFAVQVDARLAEEIRAPVDYVLLTCKAYDFESAIEAIKPAVGPDTAILPQLNGMSHMDTLNQAFGKARVLGGIAAIGITMLPDGRIRHLNDWHTITFGEQDGSISPRIMTLKAAFDLTKARADAVPDIMQRMWEKVVMLSTLASMTSLMRATVGEIARVRDGSGLMLALLERNARIAAAEGYPMPDAVMQQYQRMLTDPASQMAASMLRDVERKGPVEADHIVGFMLEKARAHGLDDMLHRICLVHLKAYEQRRTAGRL